MPLARYHVGSFNDAKCSCWTGSNQSVVGNVPLHTGNSKSLVLESVTSTVQPVLYWIHCLHQTRRVHAPLQTQGGTTTFVSDFLPHLPIESHMWTMSKAPSQHQRPITNVMLPNNAFLSCILGKNAVSHCLFCFLLVSSIPRHHKFGQSQIQEGMSYQVQQNLYCSIGDVGMFQFLSYLLECGDPIPSTDTKVQW